MVELKGTHPRPYGNVAIRYPDSPVPLKARVNGEWVEIGEATVAPVNDHLEITAFVEDNRLATQVFMHPEGFSIGYKAPQDAAGAAAGAMRPNQLLYLPMLHKKY